MGRTEEKLHALGRLPLFAESDPSDLGELAATLREVAVPRGQTIMERGESGGWFAIVVDGEADITRDDGDGVRSLGTAGPGSVLGEIALLTSTRRSATVTATQPVTALVGGAPAFAMLLDVPGIRARVSRTAAQRLAAHARTVATRLSDGTELGVRPGLSSDRDRLVRGLEQMSEQSRRRRFFSAGPVPERVIDYLVDIDYVDHFAWIATEPTTGDGVGSARYIRSATDRDTAEVAFGVVDEYQGRGIGKLLLGALAVAAPIAEISRFRATVLRDNTPVRRMLDRAGAAWTREEPGVLAATVDVATVRGLLEPGLATELRAAAEHVITAAHLALA